MKKILFLVPSLFSFEIYAANQCRPQAPLSCVSADFLSEKVNRFKGILEREQKAIPERISFYRRMTTPCPDKLTSFDKEERTLRRQYLRFSKPILSLSSVDCDDFTCVTAALKELEGSLRYTRDVVEQEQKRVSPVLNNLKKMASDCNVKQGKPPL